MKKIVCLGVSALFLLVFSPADAVDLVSRNTANLKRVKTGMSKEKVLDVMGADKETFRQRIYFEGYIAGYQDVVVKNPYHSELKKLGEEDYEIVYYFTDYIGLRVGYWDEAYRNKGIAVGGLTPLVFHDGRLVGSGWDFVEEKGKKPLSVDEEYYWLYWGNGNGGGH